MARYLLAMHQPVGPPPEPQILGEIMAHLDVVRTELQDAGFWVFAGGLHDPGASTVLR